jgi:hypothetical protein
MKAINRLRSVERDIRFIVAIDGAGEAALDYAEGHGLGDISVSADPEILGVIDGRSRPFALVLADDGTVLGTGVPNTLEQVEALLAIARHRHLTQPDSGESDVRDELLDHEHVISQPVTTTQ